MVKHIITNSSFLLLLLLSNLLHSSLSIRTTGITFLHPYLASLSSSSSTKSFNVEQYGAKGDGETDATQAFLNAWNDACSSSSSQVRLYVPKGTYALKRLSFEGSCKTSNLLFQIDGILVPSSDDYRDSTESYSWIVFHAVDGLHIKGGTLDGKGKSLWDCKEAHQQCPKGAVSLSLDNAKSILIEGLTSKDSQMFHVTINACENVNIVGLIVSAPDESPNTDGIHMERSQGITIMHSNFQTGDDCISIGPNNHNIWIEDVHCGPGHGISIGSLGRNLDDNDVQVGNVTVKSTTFSGTQNGLRIKTWATPVQGLVQDVYYLGAHMTNVHNPIIIDQNYCPQSNCPSGQASGIKIQNVVFNGIHGTSASPVAMTFDCSSEHPCEGLTLQDIDLSHGSETVKSDCKNAYGKSIGSLEPSSCLR